MEQFCSGAGGRGETSHRTLSHRKQRGEALTTTESDKLLRLARAAYPAQERKALVLSVPSAVIPEERNYLINPQHRAAEDVEVTRRRPFDFDPRLFE